MPERNTRKGILFLFPIFFSNIVARIALSSMGTLCLHILAKFEIIIIIIIPEKEQSHPKQTTTGS
jgi:hypothetical protein